MLQRNHASYVKPRFHEWYNSCDGQYIGYLISIKWTQPKSHQLNDILMFIQYLAPTGAWKLESYPLGIYRIPNLNLTVRYNHLLSFSLCPHQLTGDCTGKKTSKYHVDTCDVKTPIGLFREMFSIKDYAEQPCMKINMGMSLQSPWDTQLLYLPIVIL